MEEVRQLVLDTNEPEDFTIRLSKQAVLAIMMTLQKGIMEGIDITEVLLGFEFEMDAELDALVVKNPPTVKADDPEEEEE